MFPERVLFIPVSSPTGIGEYMRSMIIARALKKRWSDLEVHFILNKHVSYFSHCPYVVHSCNDSPTKETQEVNSIINKINPELVIFDASGRAKQFAQAKAIGAKVAFISQHNKKRNRGLKINRLFNTDIHWVVQPDYCMKPLSVWHRAKLHFFNKLTPKNIGPVFELSDTNYQQQLLDSLNLIQGQYIVFNAGSGGHLIEQNLAAKLYFQAAQNIASHYKIKCIMVFGDNYPEKLPSVSDVICIRSMDNQDFISILANAMVCVISAGDTLLQCMTLKKRCVAAPISPDQPARLKLCQRQPFVKAARANTQSIVEQVKILMNDRKDNNNTYYCQPSSNSLEIIIKDIDLLFNPYIKNDE
jgi:ADP-heptose:LPS heptosyltransferase